MTESDFDSLVDTSAHATPPNFDDERTILSARPVVPLARIDAKVRQRRNWFLGGAFAIAMMLGAASALLASYLKLRNAPTTVSEISQVETPVAPVAVAAEPMASDLPVVEDTEESGNTEASATEVEPQKAPAVRHRTVRRNPVLTPLPEVPQASEEDQLQRIREAVLYDAWQERRARRVARRERRSRVDHHNRDLSNLDEIFEGPRRRPY